MNELKTHDPEIYLSNCGIGRRVVHYDAKSPFFAQGDAANFVLYIKSGRARLAVISKQGKEATLSLLTAGDFVGEESIVGARLIRPATAIAITDCVVLRIGRAEFAKELHDERAFSDMFLDFVLARSLRARADLIDHLFNSSEKRLARTLLLMAGFDQPGEPERQIPLISQETIAEMIGTTRSRVSYFMNKFRKLGYIKYKRGIRVHESLRTAFLADTLPTDYSATTRRLNSSGTQILPIEARSHERLFITAGRADLYPG